METVGKWGGAGLGIIVVGLIGYVYYGIGAAVLGGVIGFFLGQYVGKLFLFLVGGVVGLILVIPGQ